MTIAAVSTYNKRKAPQAYDAAFFDVEHANIQRAIREPSSVVVITDYVAKISDTLIAADATAGVLSVLLPDPARVANFPLTIIKTDASGNAVTVVGTASGVVDPSLAAQWDSITIQSIGTMYLTLASQP